MPDKAARSRKRDELPEWLLQKVLDVPEAGTGLHAWLFSVARQLHAHMEPGAIIALLTTATANAGRPVPLREIRDAVNNSLTVAWRPGGATPRHGKSHNGRSLGSTEGSGSTGNPADRTEDSIATHSWPEPDPVARYFRLKETEAGGVGSLYDLWERSPVRLDEDQPWGADDWLDWLLPDAEWICLAVDHPATARSRRREKWTFGAADGCGLVVPSPMTGPSGKGLDGRVSHRCLDNTGERRWLVIEFDSGTLDEQAALHWHLRAASLAAGWPQLKLAVHSGGKSLHGWYGPCGCEDRSRELMAYAVSLGADRATWNRCQLVRLPFGKRGHSRQEVFFFDPAQ